METTNFENSKKLAEIGFKADYDYCYSKDNEKSGKWNKAFEIDCWDEHEDDKYYPSYDLETLLDALPADFMDKWGYDQYFYFDAASRAFYYEDIHGGPRSYEIVQKCSENLATTAARLLIKLVEDKIIKIGG